jgi:hypothetical protein
LVTKLFNYIYFHFRPHTATQTVDRKKNMEFLTVESTVSTQDIKAEEGTTELSTSEPTKEESRVVDNVSTENQVAYDVKDEKSNGEERDDDAARVEENAFSANENGYYCRKSGMTMYLESIAKSEQRQDD